MEDGTTIGRMEIRVLGCSGNTVREHRASAFLLNEKVLLDAGTTTDVLDDDEIGRITCAIISHAHLDHIKGLFSLFDERLMRNLPGVALISAEPILHAIMANLLNDLIWPDLTGIPSVREAMIRLVPLETEKTHVIEGLEVMAVPVGHTVFALGFIITEGNAGFAYTGDTDGTGIFWESAKREERLRFIIAEVSFPERRRDLALASGHMTLSMLTDQLDRHELASRPVYITHIKPVFRDEIEKEIAGCSGYNLTVLRQDNRFVL